MSAATHSSAKATLASVSGLTERTRASATGLFSAALSTEETVTRGTVDDPA